MFNSPHCMLFNPYVLLPGCVKEPFFQAFNQTFNYAYFLPKEGGGWVGLGSYWAYCL